MSKNDWLCPCVIRQAKEIQSVNTDWGLDQSLDLALDMCLNPEDYAHYTDAELDRYAVEVQNGNGYYDEYGNYVSYHIDDDAYWERKENELLYYY